MYISFSPHALYVTKLTAGRARSSFLETFGLRSKASEMLTFMSGGGRGGGGVSASQ